MQENAVKHYDKYEYSEPAKALGWGWFGATS